MSSRPLEPSAPDELFVHWTARRCAQAERALEACLPRPGTRPERLHEAMRYAALGGGKRVRPLLVYAAGELTGAPAAALDAAACAVECIHAYSLVHDDLPCMDNDVLRRGKPTVHVAYGEATAMLVGDALQALAFESLAGTMALGVAAPAVVSMTLQLARASGSIGMAGGQAIDLEAVGASLSGPTLEDMHRRKTGALLGASIELGAACGRAPEPGQARWLASYAQAIGLAFQVVDDILDVVGDAAALGKTAGKDAEHGKPTYVSVLGLAASRQLADTLLLQAREAVAALGPRARRLGDIAELIVLEAVLTHGTFPLLERIASPHDLRGLDRVQLRSLAQELRAFLLESVARTGGHLSSNLGTVELAIALHYVFDTPRDRLVWDVGHQSYPHKILTGRRDRMHTLRQFGGISGFPRRSESEYDTFGTAHSSTSISAALGMAVASRHQGDNQGPGRRRHVAVIGDGAMTAGMAFEAMNNAGVTPDIDLLVILNDNDMSISPPVGALNRYLARLMSGQFYSKARDVGRAVLSKVPPVFELARRFEEHAKGMVVPGTMFEEFGFNYVGPIDGHDLESLIPTLHNLRELRGPQFLHIVTRKGQGYKLAEADPVLYHGPGKFDPSQGIQKPATPPKPTFTQVFSDWICDMAAQDSRLMAVTPAMREGSGLVEFEKRFPRRYFDVGIAEQHAVTFAAGIACEGLKPVVAIYSTFLQRGYDQLIHDVALQNLPVVFALDRAGLVGADGATHAGAFDYAYLRCIPNMVVLAPSDENECRQMLYTAFQHDGPSAVRYPRGAGTGAAVVREFTAIPMGKAERRREGKRIALLAFGTMLAPALVAGEALGATVVNMRWVKPIDDAMLKELAASHDALVTIEEHVVAGGAGSAVAESLAAQGLSVPLLQIGLPDRFVDHGEQAQLLRLESLDAGGIERRVRERFTDLLSPVPKLVVSGAA